MKVIEAKVPELRFPEFNDELEFTNLKENSILITKGTTPKKFFPFGINFIKIECIEEYGINVKKSLFIDIQTHQKELSRSMLEVNDLLFAIAGATIGKCGIVKNDMIPANTNQALSIIRLKDKIDQIYVLNLLKSTVMKHYIYKNIAAGAQPNLNLEQIGNFTFNIPTLTEQTKIADFLSTVDQKIEQLNQKLKLWQKYKQGLMQQLFSQQLRFKDETGKDFTAWEEKRLGDVFSRVKGKNAENSLNVLTISARHGLINQQEYFNKSVSAKNVTGYYLLEKDDFAYNKSYSKGYPMGAIKRLNRYEKGVVSTLYICFRCKKPNSPSFYEHYFNSGIVNKELHKIAQEGARNHGLLNLSVVEFFNDLLILQPSLPEQQKFAEFLTSLDRKIELVSQQLEQMQSWKQGLLQKMFV